jgi:hypothetical protein
MGSLKVKKVKGLLATLDIFPNIGFTSDGLGINLLEILESKQ